MAASNNTIQVEWNHLCAQAKEHWNQLTEEDLKVARGNLEQLVAKIEQKTGDGRDAIEKFFSDVRSRGSAAVSDASHTAREYAHEVEAQAQQRYDNATGLVRRHPTETVLAAFGIGLVAGVFVGLVNRSR